MVLSWKTLAFVPSLICLFYTLAWFFCFLNCKHGNLSKVLGTEDNLELQIQKLYVNNVLCVASTISGTLLRERLCP